MDLTIEGQEELHEGVGAPSRGAGDRTHRRTKWRESSERGVDDRYLGRASGQSELPRERSKQGTSLPKREEQAVRR
jgi:hypothetical protein